MLICINCAAKPRSRHRVISMNVAKPKSKDMIRKCITGTKGSQTETKSEPKRCQNGAKRTSKLKKAPPFCGTGTNTSGNGMRKGCQCMPKGCQHEPTSIPTVIKHL